MQAHALLSIDRERLRPFFERVPELFESYHHSEQHNPDGYEELLYRVYRPYNRQMLDMIDEWMGLEQRN